MNSEVGGKTLNFFSIINNFLIKLKSLSHTIRPKKKLKKKGKKMSKDQFVKKMKGNKMKKHQIKKQKKYKDHFKKTKIYI
jgi:hypothetical protein